MIVVMLLQKEKFVVWVITRCASLRFIYAHDHCATDLGHGSTSALFSGARVQHFGCTSAFEIFEPHFGIVEGQGAIAQLFHLEGGYGLAPGEDFSRHWMHFIWDGFLILEVICIDVGSSGSYVNFLTLLSRP